MVEMIARNPENGNPVSSSGQLPLTISKSVMAKFFKNWSMSSSPRKQ